MQNGKRLQKGCHLVRRTVNSTGYPKLEEPIRLLKKYYPEFCHMLNQAIRKLVKNEF